MVMSLDLRLKGRGFESRPFHFHVTTLGKWFVVRSHVSSFHCYDTRQKDHFHTYTVLSDLGKKSVKYKGSKLWNALPFDVKDIKSLQTFKCVLRKYMLHSGT